jgi:hypothetical protein
MNAENYQSSSQIAKQRTYSSKGHITLVLCVLQLLQLVRQLFQDRLAFVGPLSRFLSMQLVTVGLNCISTFPVPVAFGQCGGQRGG